MKNRFSLGRRKFGPQIKELLLLISQINRVPLLKELGERNTKTRANLFNGSYIGLEISSAPCGDG